MSRPEPMINARRERAADAHQRAHKALAAMVRGREPITFAAVAARAGVSREFLYRVPDLAAKIRDVRSSTPSLVSAEARQEPHSIIAALRDHIRRLETQHATDLSRLRAENSQLRGELEAALGQILTNDAARPNHLSPPRSGRRAGTVDA